MAGSGSSVLSIIPFPTNDTTRRRRIIISGDFFFELKQKPKHAISTTLRDFYLSIRMSKDHVVLGVEPESQKKHGGEDSPYEAAHQSSRAFEATDDRVIAVTEDDEQEPLIQIVECRICQEEDSIKNLESPCACSGSLKFAHRKCVQRWCNEKGDTICEICNQPYQSGYTAPPPLPHSEETMIDISEGRILDLRDPRILAMAAAERHFREAEYDEYGDNNASGASFCRSVVLILMALLLMRHTLYLTSDSGDEDDDDSTSFSLFLLRAAGFLLPFYIMAWAISILQQRRQRQEAAALAAAEAAMMQHHSLQITVEPAAPPHNQEAQPQPQTHTQPQSQPQHQAVQ